MLRNTPDIAVRMPSLLDVCANVLRCVDLGNASEFHREHAKNYGELISSRSIVVNEPSRMQHPCPASVRKSSRYPPRPRLQCILDSSMAVATIYVTAVTEQSVRETSDRIYAYLTCRMSNLRGLINTTCACLPIKLDTRKNLLQRSISLCRNPA
jgi:hypothetical protein